MNNIDTNIFKDFYRTNKSVINYALISVLISLGAIYYYFEMYKKPREKMADDNIFIAQKYFKQDSFDLALNGNGKNKGFLGVIKNYSGTKAANLSHYYCAVIYLNKGELEKCLTMIKKFSTKSVLFKGYSKIVMADALSELNRFDESVKLYKEAAEILKNDNIMGSQALLKAGIMLEVQNKIDLAASIYRALVKRFPLSKQRKEAEKYLAKLGVE